MMNQKTEDEKLAELQDYVEKIKIGFGPNWPESKMTARAVRQKIREIWGLKKSAANEKFRKLFIFDTVGYEDKEVESDDGKIYSMDFKNGSKIVVVDKPNQPLRGLNSGDLYVDAPSPKVTLKNDKQTVEVKGVNSIKSIDDLIAYCKVDLNKWEPKSFVPSLQRGVLNFRAEFKKRADQQNLESLLQTFTQHANERAPKTFNIKPTNSSGDDLYVISIQDLHIGKLAHGVQTLWGDFDISIAKKYYKDAAEQLISEAPIGKIGKVLLIIGSDLIHYENQRVETSSGTKIEGDSRWHKVFDESCQLIAETVESLAVQFPVEVMVVAGNHANLSEYALGAYIKAFFRNHSNVNVNNEPSNRKYFSHGKTLIGFAHGDGVKKLDDLGAVMMREKMDVISNYKHLYWLTGHKHVFQQMLDSRGVRIFVSAALCNPDQWHAANSYVGNIQGSEGYLFSAEDGLTQIVFSKSVNKQ